MDFNIRQMLAGIGILLYGMHNFEQALNFLGGKKLKFLLQKYTKTGWMAIWTGTWTTTLLQSSTLVSLLILAFVGVGAMPLYNAIGVIIGANVGSPMLPLFAALVGFNEFDIATLAYPLIGVGAIILMFIKSEKRLRYAKLIIGFGLFFIGIGFMKESVEAIKNSFSIEDFAHLSLRGFGILGMVFSALMSSSGALGIITITAVGGGIITFPASVAVMMGANIGTTRTAFLASLGGNKAKRQVAMSHVLFNVLSTIFGIALFWQFIWFSNDVLGLEHNPALSNAVLSVVYNLTACLIFGFLLKPFTKLVIWAVPHKKDEGSKLQIESIQQNITQAGFLNPALMALHEDVKTLATQGHAYISFIYGITLKHLHGDDFTPEKVFSSLKGRDKQEHIKLYEETKKTADTLLLAVSQLKQFKMEKSNAKQLHDIETSIYSTLKATKAIKNIHADIVDLRETIDPEVADMYHHLVATQITIGRHLNNVRDDQASNYEELILAVETLKKHHKIFIKKMSTSASEGKLKEVGITTLVNVDHYFFEANEKLALGYANAYLTPEKIEAFEATQDIDEEIYESFSTD